MLTTRALNVVDADVCVGLVSNRGAGLGGALTGLVLIPAGEQDTSKIAVNVTDRSRISGSFIMDLEAGPIRKDLSTSVFHRAYITLTHTMSYRLRTITGLSFGRGGISVLALILSCLLAASAQTAQKGSRVVSISPSDVIKKVSERARQKPSLSAAELAAFGNELVARNGFDYQFDLCDILNHRNPTRSTPAEFFRNYPMTLTGGGKLTFKIPIINPYESLCGECWSAIPSFQVTSKEMALIAQGKRYRVRRPKSFILDEAQLVDETLKKVLRTWQMPYQAVPVGISPDGTKLYLDFYGGLDLDHLVLEVPENGTPQFRDRAVIQSGEGKSIEDHPKDPNNGYLSFMSFQVGGKTYRVKFSAPCT